MYFIIRGSKVGPCCVNPDTLHLQGVSAIPCLSKKLASRPLFRAFCPNVHQAFYFFKSGCRDDRLQNIVLLCAPLRKPRLLVNKLNSTKLSAKSKSAPQISQLRKNQTFFIFIQKTAPIFSVLKIRSSP